VAAEPHRVWAAPSAATPNHQSEKDIGENIEGKHEGDALSRNEKSGERRSKHPGKIEADRFELCSGPRFAGWRKLRGQGLIGRVRED